MGQFADRAYKAVTVAIIRAVGEDARYTLEVFQALAAEYMHSAVRPRSAANTTGKLYEGTGSLKRALIRGKRGNIFTVDANAALSTITIGIDGGEIPYAAIHEYGGQIPITPRMRRYFWAVYKETGATMWMALALTKRTHITIPARPFFEPATEQLATTELDILLASITDKVAEAFNTP